MSTVRNVRFVPAEATLLGQYVLNNGDVFYDGNNKTLVLFDGLTKGGIPLLRADLSNIAGGGGGGAGTVNFGGKTLQAVKFVGAFQGDGSLLTNLPIPPNLATQTFVTNAVSTAFNTKATTTSLGTVKIGAGITIAPDGTISAASSNPNQDYWNSIKFANSPVTITAFTTDGTLASNSDAKLPTEKAVKSYVQAQIGQIDFGAIGTIDTGLNGQIAFYKANGKGLAGAGNLYFDPITEKLSTGTVDATLLKGGSGQITGTLSVTGTTTANNVTVNGALLANTTATVTGLLTANGSIKTTSIYNDGLGFSNLIFGADLWLDVPGEITLINGNVIKNAGDPVDAQDLATKSYVDGSAASFQGGDVPGAVRILDTTQSIQLTVTATLGTVGGIPRNELTVASTVGLSANTPIVFTGNTFGGVQPNVVYYISTIVNGTTFTISATLGGPVFTLSTTSSISMIGNTGSLTTSGGISSGGNIWAAGTIYQNGSAVLTSLSGGYNGGTVTGTIIVNNTTASTSPTTGAIRTTGGIGVAKTINVGGDGTFNGINVGAGADPGNGSPFNVAIGGGTITALTAPLSSNLSGINDIAIGYGALAQSTNSQDSIAIGVGASGNRTAGDFTVAIGSNALQADVGSYNVGIGPNAGKNLGGGSYNLLIGGFDGTGVTSDGNVIFSDGLGNVRFAVNNAGAISLGSINNIGPVGYVFTSGGPTAPPTWSPPPTFTGGNVANATTIQSTTASSSTTTGALIVSGGMGVSGAVYAGSFQGPIGTVTRATAAFTTLDANGDVVLSSSTGSTSTTTGAIKIGGGVGIVENLYVGGIVGLSGGYTASSTSTGTLRVTGGIGATGAIYVVGLNSSASSSITANTTSSATNNGALTVTGGVGIGENLNVGGIVKLSNNTSASNTTSGTLQVTGGVGITGDVYANTFNGGIAASSGTINNASIGATTRSSGAFTSLAANGTVTVQTTTNNQSYTTTGAGTITISSGAAGTIDNMSIGGTTRGTGAFTSLAANSSVTFTANVNSTSSTVGGTLTVTGGAAISGDLYVGGGINGASVTFSSINNTQIGNTTPAAGTFTILTANGLLNNPSFVIPSTALTSTAWTTSGIGMRINARTYTDSSSTGTVATSYIHSLGSPTFASNNTITITEAANLFVAAPAAGTGSTLTGGGFSIVAGGRLKATEGVLTQLTVNGANVNTTISPTGTGTVTIAPAGAISITGSAGLTLGTAGQTTTMAGNISATTSNQTVTLSPTGTGTVAISPVGALTINPTAASTINNTSIGVSTPLAGRFTTLTLNSANQNSTLSPTGTSTITISPGSTLTLGTAAVATTMLGNIGATGSGQTFNFAPTGTGGTFTVNPTAANVSITTTTSGTVTINPAGGLTLGTAGQTTTMAGNISATTNNQTFNFAPGGTGGTFTVNPTAANVTINTTTSGSISITGAAGLTLGTLGQTTTMNGNISATGNNQTVTLSPTGTGTVAISPVGALTINPTAASTINNTSIGATTRSTGAFTTLAANAAVTLTAGANNSSLTTTGAGVLTISSGTLGSIDNMTIGGTTSAAATFTQMNMASTAVATAQWNNAGISIKAPARTFTDNSTANNGTVATSYIHALGAPTFSATANNFTITEAANLFVAAPVAGTTGNGTTTFTNAWSIVAGGRIKASAIDGTPIGSTTASTGAFTSLSATSFTLTGGINGTAVGNTTPSTGAFTTLSATQAVTFNTTTNNQSYTTTGAGTITITSGTAGTINNMSIGATTATTGRFTTIESTIATGTAPFTVASTTNVANLNASSLNGATFASPGAIGGTTASTATFTQLTVNGANLNTSISPTGTGTVTINPAGAISITGSAGLTLGTAGQTTTMAGNISATTNNQTVTLSPTGTGTVTINPATASNINNMNIGATTRGTGAFTTLAANNAVTLTAGANNSSFTTTGAGVLTISSGTLGTIDNMTIGGTTRAGGNFTTLQANSTVTFTAAVGMSPANANVTISPTGTGTVTVNPATAGSIDNVTIGATTATTGRFTTITSTIATGTAPFTVASTTNVANLNASSLNGATFASPGAIGGTTASTGRFTTIESTIATGTAPFTVASTTNVANLNASSLNGATFASPGTIGSGTPGAATFTSVTSTGLARLESVSNVVDLSVVAPVDPILIGSQTFDFATSAKWYISAPANDFTANFTNVPTTNGASIEVELIVNQGLLAGYAPTAVEIAGVSQSVIWNGGTPPTASTNKTDKFKFTLLRTTGAWVVLGDFAAYS